jgi:hypothetical protein
VRVVAETLANRNFYNEKLWDNENHSIPENVLKELGHVGSFFVPFSVTGVIREHERGAGTGMQVGQFLGLRTAPAYVTRTPAVRYMDEYFAEHSMGYSTPTEASKIGREITKAMRAGNLDKALRSPPRPSRKAKSTTRGSTGQ